jgi:hypothetical protein
VNVSKILSRTALVSTVSALCLFSLVGCDVTTWSGNDTPRGKELESILLQKRKIETTAPAGLPLAFNPVEVEKTTDKDHGVLFSAALGWGLSDTPESLQTKLGVPGRPDLTVSQVVLRIAYFDAHDLPCGEDRVELELQDSNKVPQAKGLVHLTHIGEKGSPVRAVASLDSFTIVKREAKVAVK